MLGQMLGQISGKDGRPPKPSLVVRKHAPTRRIILIAAVALIGLFTAYVIYEFGRYNAGYDRMGRAAAANGAGSRDRASRENQP